VPAALHLTHEVNDAVTLAWGDAVLFRYVYLPDTDPRDSPRPYFHPLRTLAGELVTNAHPPDHPWHTGLSMTFASVSGENFWGGPTYIHGQGYVQRDNNGRQVHRTWAETRCDAEGAALTETLAWVSYGGETLLAEEREIAVREVNAAEGYYRLDCTMHLTNVSGRPLTLGSPTTGGRPMAGYGSLFWRGSRAFLGGTVRAAGERSGPEMMGQRAPWLAVIGGGDGGATACTLVFLDHPENPRYPTQRFVRTDSYAGVSFALVFDAEYSLAPDANITMRYRIVIADGAWSRERIEAHTAHRDANG